MINADAILRDHQNYIQNNQLAITRVVTTSARAVLSRKEILDEEIISQSQGSRSEQSFHDH